MSVLLMCLVASASAESGYIQKRSPYGVKQTLDRLQNLLEKKGVTIFARIDHAAGAEKAGLKMKDTQLLIFGNPKLGTPLMIEKRLVGLDLPMKVLAWQDDNNQTWIAYTRPEELQKRYGMKNEAVIDKMKNALNELTNKAVESNSR